MTEYGKISIVVLLFVCVGRPLLAQADSTTHDYELTGGASICLYQSVFSFKEAIGFEAALRSHIGGAWDWQAGVRLGIQPALPEAFVRLLVSPGTGMWQPVVGLELGITRRARFDAGKKLLQETRVATEGDISPVYGAVHAAPLTFRFLDGWRVSLLELQFGTHLRHVGRTIRIQAGLVSIGATL